MAITTFIKDRINRYEEQSGKRMFVSQKFKMIISRINQMSILIFILKSVKLYTWFMCHLNTLINKNTYIYTLYLIQIFKYFIFSSRIKELFHLWIHTKLLDLQHNFYIKTSQHIFELNSNKSKIYKSFIQSSNCKYKYKEPLTHYQN